MGFFTEMSPECYFPDAPQLRQPMNSHERSDPLLRLLSGAGHIDPTNRRRFQCSDY